MIYFDVFREHWQARHPGKVLAYCNPVTLEAVAGFVPKDHDGEVLIFAPEVRIFHPELEVSAL